MRLDRSRPERRRRRGRALGEQRRARALAARPARPQGRSFPPPPPPPCCRPRCPTQTCFFGWPSRESTPKLHRHPSSSRPPRPSRTPPPRPVGSHRHRQKIGPSGEDTPRARNAVDHPRCRLPRRWSRSLSLYPYPYPSRASSRAWGTRGRGRTRTRTQRERRTPRARLMMACSAARAWAGARAFEMPT